MSTILAAVDASTAARPVLDTAARAGAGRCGCPRVAFHVRQDGPESERLLAERAVFELRLAAGVPPRSRPARPGAGRPLPHGPFGP